MRTGGMEKENSRVSEMALAWTMLPIPKEAAAQSPA